MEESSLQYHFCLLYILLPLPYNIVQLIYHFHFSIHFPLSYGRSHP